MTHTLLLAAATVLTIGVGTWCGWHCLRTMRRGRAGSQCTAPLESTEVQLAQLRGELAKIKSARAGSGSGTASP